ncbi:NAD-dependent epimerase/dehydratase family protein [Aminivibrio sp.]|uniref:NAD-dependent epimerase/dehydratase family protein n=1 Tax=Aminivibrio sp. TaxID=1872489 RepID=UPI001A42D2C3|nr:NAD-dependent epimerase/dehydratase family protein [Aminivibrio sp.]MBL3539864.1 NAD-dependent epimerase/dehydratase family protein [Aminivibrio sp.]
MKKVFITGTTGFVGGHLKNHLTGKGYEVIAPTRNDLGDPFSVEAWRKALEKAECETVVHLIAKTHAADAGNPSALPSYRHINVDITKALLEASKDLGVKKFIYLSSIKAVGEETPIDEPFTEESPCRPEDCYGISKKETEELVLKYSRTIDTIILRPPMIYGPGVKGNFLKLMNAVKRGIPLPFASVRNARSLVFVGNLSDAIEHIVESHLAGGSLFHIADEETPSTPELLKLMASALNVKPRVLPFSVTLLETLASMAGKQETIKKITRSLIVSSSKASRNFDWKPFYSLQVGINQSLNIER